MKRVLLLSLLCSCAHFGARGDVSDDPGLREAVRTVWVDAYQRTDVPPKVRIVGAGELTCTQKESGRPGFLCAGSCRGGCTVTPLEVSITHDEGEPWSDGLLSHELQHADHLRRGIFDPQHRGPEWIPLEQCEVSQLPACGAVEAANILLKSIGR